MALFKKKPRTTNKSVQTVTELWSKSFPQSGSFKGFRRINLTTYKEDGVADNLAYFEKNGISKGQTVQLQCVAGDGWQAVNVYVDARRIGCLYSTHSQWNMISASNYDKVYAKVDNEGTSLFLHFL